MLPSAHETSPYSLPVGTTREWHGCTLTLTAEGWRAEVKHSMHRRCKGWDYGKPWIYMVTLSTQHHDVAPQPLVDGYRLPEWLERQYAQRGHPHLFGELAPELDANGRASVRLNAFGQAVEKEIDSLPLRYPQRLWEVTHLRRLMDGGVLWPRRAHALR